MTQSRRRGIEIDNHAARELACGGGRGAPGVLAMHELPTGVPIYGYIYGVKPSRLIEVPAATKAGEV